MYETQDNSEKVIYIPTKSIKPSPYQPRKFIDVTSVSNLAESISEIGLLEPVSVRRLGDAEYELVSGERRLKATEIAGIEKIKAKVLDISDNQSAVYTLAENVQHRPLDFFEMAFGFYHLIFEHGISRELLAKKLGISEKEISAKLSLCKLSSTVRNIIIENKLSEEYAHILLEVEDENQRRTYLKKCIEKNFSPKEFKEYIFTPVQIPTKKKKIKINDQTIVFNTIKKAVGMMCNMGVQAKINKKEYKKHFEYTIKILKQ